MNTIFKEKSLKTNWESYMDELTPWENHNGVWFKREDYYAPLGYGGPNGAKLRQLQHLFKEYRGNARYVVTGASVLSPQHSMTGILSAYYGLPSYHVIGATNPASSLKHPNIRVARGFGAHFDYINVAYNPALQKRVGEITRDDAFVVPYGITVDHKAHPERLTAFHNVGARQVDNIPDDVQVLIIPAGSCNSITSVLLGLARNPHNVKTVFAVGIGPDKREWVRERMALMGYPLESLPFKLKDYSLHKNGVKYSDRVIDSFDGINFHPNYEGKVIRYLKQQGAFDDADGQIGFWIIGSEPKLSVIEPHFTHPIQEDIIL
ncbi:hypothetical protein UFOVP139_19 [uncultured Caudovirales phage]|uniref:Pyridoxal-phosphate dependent enzyme n=1 Tax=uncultured Caudovirales phage TaxID=2100421 RepID=A0A6J5LCF6_9CAUD|nr:hypothetical protein UFOVP139_19 [uncultured Caudovirales phage]